MLRKFFLLLISNIAMGTSAAFANPVISTSVTSPTTNSTVPVTVKFSAPIQDFSISNAKAFTLVNASLAGPVTQYPQVNPYKFSFNLVATNPGTFSMLINANAFTRNDGKKTAKSNILSLEYTPSVAFTALHTYYISPTGNDQLDGTTPATAWLSPKHPVSCGDVIIAAPGQYSNENFAARGNWGSVTNCPSTSGGIDGTGGIYEAQLLCGGSSVGDCYINADPYTAGGMLVDSSNWAVVGWKVTDTAGSYGSCFVATPSGEVTLHHIAFVNDIAEGCVGSGVQSTNYYGNGKFGVDEFAAVGIIAHAASIGVSECYSGLSVAGPANYDTAPGTHIFVAGVFSYGNINGYCGINSNYVGGYGPATKTVSSGNLIQVQYNGSTARFQVGMPISDIGPADGDGLPTGAIPPNTYIQAISGGTIHLSITLSNNLTGQVNAGGSWPDIIVATTTTDGEGIIFDTWGSSSVSAYNGQGVAEQNMLWGNGSAGIEVFNSTTGSTPIYIFNNTTYGNLQDPKHSGVGGELLVQSVTTPLTITNNIFQSSLTSPGNLPLNTGLQLGEPVYASVAGNTNATIAGNFFKGMLASCEGPYGPVCDPGDNVAAWNGFVYGSNTYQSPAFANPQNLPTEEVSCSGYPTTTACMIAAGVVADLKASGGAASEGYQPPGECTSDPYFPAWLKGAVGLSVTSGSILNYSTQGLITKPCGM